MNGESAAPVEENESGELIFATDVFAKRCRYRATGIQKAEGTESDASRMAAAKSKGSRISRAVKHFVQAQSSVQVFNRRENQTQ